MSTVVLHKIGVNQVYQLIGRQIAEGLNRPTIRTEKAIDELHDANNKIVHMSNIGGGSKETAGSGQEKTIDRKKRNNLFFLLR